jgi:hypothetical protein
MRLSSGDGVHGGAWCSRSAAKGGVPGTAPLARGAVDHGPVIAVAGICVRALDRIARPRCRWSSSLAGDDVRLSRRSAPAQQRPAISGRPAHRRGDRRGHADRRRRTARSSASRPDRRVVARRPPHRRSAITARAGPRPPSWLAARPARRGRATSRGRDGRLGMAGARTLARRTVALPIGPLLCILNGRTRGRPWSTSGARAELRRAAGRAGVRRRFAPHQLRHAHAVEMAREGVPLIVIQRQLGHSNPRHHLGLFARHRQRRNHRDGPRPPRTGDPGQREASGRRRSESGAWTETFRRGLALARGRRSAC